MTMFLKLSHFEILKCTNILVVYQRAQHCQVTVTSLSVQTLDLQSKAGLERLQASPGVFALEMVLELDSGLCGTAGRLGVGSSSSTRTALLLLHTFGFHVSFSKV